MDISHIKSFITWRVPSSSAPRSRPFAQTLPPEFFLWRGRVWEPDYVILCYPVLLCAFVCYQGWQQQHCYIPCLLYCVINVILCYQCYPVLLCVFVCYQGWQQHSYIPCLWYRVIDVILCYRVLLCVFVCYQGWQQHSYIPCYIFHVAEKFRQGRHCLFHVTSYELQVTSYKAWHIYMQDHSLIHIGHAIIDNIASPIIIYGAMKRNTVILSCIPKFNCNSLLYPECPWSLRSAWLVIAVCMYVCKINVLLTGVLHQQYAGLQQRPALYEYSTICIKGCGAIHFN